jgi:hypothetical protein
MSNTLTEELLSSCTGSSILLSSFCSMSLLRMYNTGLLYERINKIKKTKLYLLLELGQKHEISVLSVLL